MKCTKCGKEIPDGENEVCEECQKTIANEAKKSEAKKEKKTKTSDKKETKAKKETKPKTKKETTAKKETKSKKAAESKEETKKVDCKMIGCICAIVAVIVVIILALCMTKTSTKSAGNTIGNVRNYGYSVANGKWIYFLSPNEDYSKLGVYKIKKDGESDKTELFSEDMDIVSLNVAGKYVFFVGIGTEVPSEEDEVDNKIYRMKTDGSDLTVINDNDFNNECYEIYAVNGKIYYFDNNTNICSMDYNGQNRDTLLENGTGYLGVTGKYILFNNTVEDSEDYVTYIMNLDGSNARPVIDNTRLYSVNIVDDYIYYTDTDKKIYKTKIDSGASELVYDTTAYNLNVSEDGYAYYLNYKDAANGEYTVCAFRVKLDGSSEKPELIKEMDTYSSFLDVVGDWILYMDSNDECGFINLVKKDGSDSKELYKLNYTDYLGTGDATEAVQTEDVAPEATAEEPTAEETTQEVNQ